MRVLVVCTANVARSPLAEAMFARGFGPEVAVSSAGVRARAGDPAARGSVLLGEERGLDLTGHRSRPVTRDLVQGADLVVTMSERHRDHCAPLAAGAASHVFTLRELVRLLDAVDTDGAPAATAERLPWLVDRLHLARPRARPPETTEDVADPIGRAWPHWEQLGADLDELIGRCLEAMTTDGP